MASTVVSSSLLDVSFKMLPIWLSNQWVQRVGTDAKAGGNRQLYADFMSNTARLRTMARDFAGKTSGPMFGCAMVQMAQDTARGNMAAMQMEGIESGRSKDGQSARIEHLTPFTVGLGCVFYCSSILDQNTFCSIWLEQVGRREMRVRNNLGFEFGIAFSLDSNLSTNPNNIVESTDLFSLDSSAILYTYGGTVETVRLIRKTEVQHFVSDVPTDMSWPLKPSTSSLTPDFVTQQVFTDRYDSTNTSDITWSLV